MKARIQGWIRGAGIAFGFFVVALILVSYSAGEVAEPPIVATIAQSPSPTDDYPSFRKWTDLTEPQRDKVCDEVLKRGGPDRSGATSVLTATGLERGEVQDMYPYVVSQCLARGL
jgi:hypothetical protein